MSRVQLLRWCRWFSLSWWRGRGPRTSEILLSPLGPGRRWSWRGLAHSRLLCLQSQPQTPSPHHLPYGHLFHQVNRDNLCCDVASPQQTHNADIHLALSNGLTSRLISLFYTTAKSSEHMCSSKWNMDHRNIFESINRFTPLLKSSDFKWNINYCHFPGRCL